MYSVHNYKQCLFTCDNFFRWSLCCKSGEEMSLMHKPENHQYELVPLITNSNECTESAKPYSILST